MYNVLCIRNTNRDICFTVFGWMEGKVHDVFLKELYDAGVCLLVSLKYLFG